jgi:hypothetical protein
MIKLFEYEIGIMWFFTVFAKKFALYHAWKLLYIISNPAREARAKRAQFFEFSLIFHQFSLLFSGLKKCTGG